MSGFSSLKLVAVAAFSCSIGLTSLSGCDSTAEDPQEGESTQSATVGGAPAARELPGQRPSEALRRYQIHAPPPLTLAAHVPGFLDWAGASRVDEKEDARRAIMAAANNRAVLEALIAEIERVQDIDHTRALVALGVLGETKNPVAQAFFAKFVWRPLPQVGTVIEGELIEQTRAAQLQGKAIDGLAYINNESANKIVMEVIAKHPSKIVRAEAINAYLWNHGDSDEARSELSRFVRQDELALLDRVRRVPGETASTFNAKLERFLKKHPELIPPTPEKLSTPPKPADERRQPGTEPPAL